jgi:hypothetical protein
MDLTLDKLRATLAECGCCPPPGCCPPLVECRSGFARAASVGFVDPAFSDSSIPYSRQTRYLRRRFDSRSGVAPPPGISDYPDLSGTFSSAEYVVTWSYAKIEEFDQAFNASVAGAYFTGRDCGPDMQTAATLTYRCEITGGWTERYYDVYYDGSDWVRYQTVLKENVLSDAVGEETEDHVAWSEASAAWDAAHPDYPAEVAAYTAAHAVWQAAYDAWSEAYTAWTAAWNAWHEGGETGPEPEEPAPFTDVEPELADPRPAEPEEFYPPCTQKRVITWTEWHLVGGEVVLRPDTEESPNPYTETRYEGYVGGGLGDIPIEEWEDVLELPVTFEEFVALAEAWIATKANFDYASDSGSDACPPGDLCRATKRFYPDPASPWQSDIDIDFFQYRFKLDKCCGWQDIRSEWDTIFYPKEWLDWQIETAALGSGEDPLPEPSRPVKNPRVWTWSGTPPLCPGSSSDSGSTPADHYDYEPMWSPWSATIFVPGGDHEGVVVNRNYQQKCYEAPQQQFPELFGTYDESSDS